MEPIVIGFVGFGEAGSHLARGLRSSGARTVAFDIHAHTPGRGDLIRQRAADTQTTLVESRSELAEAALILISVVTADAAIEATRQMTPHLGERHYYADLNSISPSSKQTIEHQIRQTGASFVEGAIMSPVPPHGHRVPILMNGQSAPALIELLTPLGMRIEALSGETGAATAVKMCRSIVVKGLEALLFECVLAASRFGAEQRVFASLDESFPGVNWDRLAHYMVGRVVVHGERRAREMEEVARTLSEIGVDPIMSQATARRQEWGTQFDLRSRFGPDGPKHYSEVLAILEDLKLAKERSVE